jgi:CHAT domain-containing protein
MEVARLRALIGQVHENLGQLTQAREFYQQALQRFDGHSDRVNQATTLFILGRLEMKSGNYEIAEKHLRQSIEITENMRRLSTSRELTAAFSATVHDRYERYIQCLMRNHHESESTSRVALAFETSESARARSLAELLRVNDTNLLSSVDPELSKKERSLRQLLRIKEDRRVALLRKKYQKSDLERLDAEQEQLNTEYKNVLATINERYPAFGQLTQPQSWNLRRIQEEVIADDNTLLLEFILGPDKSIVWAVTRNSITSHELPSEAAIDGAVRKVYKLLESAKPENKNELGHASQELAQMVLSPVADQLQKQRILVAADGALNYIPFQILPVTANAEPLVAQHEVINVPSASILGELRRETARRGSRNKVLAAFGDPVFGENVPIVPSRSDSGDPETIGPLFYAAREIANLREVASEEQTYAVTESDATRDQLLKLDLSQYSILHFATHGLLRPSSPENSGLWLSTIDHEGKPVDGFVGLQDIYSLRAPVDLVVLSACQTGLGKDTRGEGLIGLTRGFMYAGATSVIASVWKVEDEATAELMKRFYTEMLKNGKTPSQALRLAQNSIRQEPQWSAPHYWAGFTLQGEYGYVVNVPPRGWQVYQIVLLSAVAVLILCGLFVFLWRRANRH